MTAFDTANPGRFDGYACVYALGDATGGPLKVGHAADASEALFHAQVYYWGSYLIHQALWFPDLLARRVCADAHRILDKAEKRLRGNWFAVPPAMMGQVIAVAARNVGSQPLTQDGMVSRARDADDRLVEARLRAYGAAALP